MHLNSTFTTWDDKLYSQTNRICIGSCIAPILSSLFLAYLDNLQHNQLQISNVTSIFYYVDDFLVIFNTDDKSWTINVSGFKLVREYFKPLVLTFKLPVERTIRFLDLKLRFSPNHICWAHEPHASKPLLPFQWSHSKLVKRSMVRTCLWNALNKSCIHSIPESFSKQMDRLQAGYPKQQLSSVTESFLEKLRNVKLYFLPPTNCHPCVQELTKPQEHCSLAPQSL